MSRINAPTSSDAAPVLELIDAFRRSKAMFVGVSMRIFDRLEEEPASAAALAAELEVNADALERLLDTLTSMFLLRKDGAEYRNTETASTFLVAASPHSMRGYILYSNDVLYKLWDNLEDAIREGSHRWRQSFGLEGPIFSSFFQTDDAMLTFLMGMHGFGQLSSPAVVKSFDLSRFQTFCDLGGATGHLVLAALDQYPQMRGILFELTAVADFARARLAKHPQASRLWITEGDFFTDDLPPADLYALGRILHDWNEEKIRILLGKIHAALPSGGGVLIAEKILFEDKSGPMAGLLQSLHMLVCTEGKERTLAEYSRLLEQAGFRQISGVRTGAPVDAILAIKE